MSSILHFKHTEINKTRWDACVTASPQFIIYGLSWYLDVVSPNWEALVWEEREEYVAVLPLPVCTKYSIRFIHQPLFCQFLPIFSTEVIDNEAFFQALSQKFRLVVRFNISTQLPKHQTLLQAKFTHLLDLSPDYQTIHQQYSSDRKLNLKRAKQFGWQMKRSEDVEPLIQLFRANHANQIEGGVAKDTYQILRKLFAEIQKRGLGELHYACSFEGTIEAGCWFVFSGRRIIYLFNAATSLGRKGNARTFLLDSFLQEQAGKSQVFDFESPDIHAIAKFYESFGAKPKSYWQVSYNGLSAWMNGLWRLKKWIGI